MKKVLLVALVLLAGCSAKTEKREVSLVLNADFASGKLLLTCRESSTGKCHVLVAGSKNAPVQLVADKGGTAQSETAAAEGAQFCAGATEPQDKCRLTPLRDGEQIFRASEVKTESH